MGRVWSPADEIVLLGGMIHYQKEKSEDPRADLSAFLEFVKGSFSFEITRNQLYDKVKRLKNKFFANIEKGDNFNPTKPLDQECFELSKKIWGGNNITGSVVNIDGDNNNSVAVGNGVGHTTNVKMVDGVWETNKSAKGKSSEGKRKEKCEKKKKVCDKKNKKMDDGPKLIVKEAEPLENEDVMKEKEDFGKDDENVMNNNECVAYEDGMKDKEDVVKDDENVANKYLMKDKEDAGNNDENVVKHSEQNILLKYPNMIASLSMDMPKSQRKVMMEGFYLVDSEKARELDDRWKELQTKEIEFHCRKMELMAEQSRLVMDALKKK